ncbi:uncharacterized oxidoreductase TM_0325-like [Colias croceus]|uniref:uncharacterized oxidoreductase TM_0325-like n=1 Tax=Colias crocea TaxID=72248 RepID=UPI001E27F8DF|nr:uncharacterized oxidoreductase TM_0325-like [Colias croceus]
MSFESKVVIVTGASSGIGEAAALAFAQEKADVVIVGRNEERLKKVAELCEAKGKAPLVLKADVTNDTDAKRIITETIEKYNKLDILVNNAGVLLDATLEDGDILSTFDETIKTNVRSVVNLTMLATPYLKASKGNVLNVSSVAGTQLVSYKYTAYCMSKAAINHFTRGAALELGRYGVRVNAISPGPVKTRLFNTSTVIDELELKTVLNRWSDSEEIADTILYLQEN